MSLINLRSKFYILNEHANAFSSSLYDAAFCLVNFFSTHPAYTRIAWNSGSVGGGLNSNGFSDSIKDQAWAVFRNNSCSITYDIAIKVGPSAYTAGGWESYSNAGLSIVAAWHSSSQAWAGTTNNNGTDQFTTTPWKSGSITTLRSNGQAGANQTNKRGLLDICVTSVVTRTNIVITGTNDYTIVHIARSREAEVAGTTNTTMFLGKYDVLTASHNLPLCQGIMPVLNTTIGSPPYLLGGGLIYTSSQIPGTLMFNIGGNGGSVTPYDKTLIYSENPNFVVEFPLWITSDLSIATPDYSDIDNGFKIFGTIPDMNVLSYNASGYRFYRNGTRLTIRDAVSDMVFSVPWDSSSLGVIEIN